MVGYLDAERRRRRRRSASRSRSRFADDPAITVGGAAVTAHQLNETTEDDLRRIELFAAPLLLLLSLFVFRGLVAALLPLVVGVLSILTTLLLLRLLTNVMEIDVFAINIVTGLGLGLGDRLQPLRRSRASGSELAAGQPTGAALSGTMRVDRADDPVQRAHRRPSRWLSLARLPAALPLLDRRSAARSSPSPRPWSACSVLPALLAMLGPRVNALAPRRLQRARASERRWYSLGRFVLRHLDPSRRWSIGRDGARRPPFLRVELTRADASVSAGRRERPPGRRAILERALRRRSGVGDRRSC